MAEYTVYPLLVGYHYEYFTPTSTGEGWRPTQRWARSAARQRTVFYVETLAEDREAAGSDAPLQAIRRRVPDEVLRPGRRPLTNFLIGVLAIAVIGVGAVAFVNSRAAPPGSSTAITILATRRLEPVLDRVTKAFESENPGAQIRLDFSLGTSFTSLPDVERPLTESSDATTSGRPEPDFVIADELTPVHADPTKSNNVIPSQFGIDAMVLVVRTGNPERLKGVADFAGKQTLRVGLCGVDQFCGVAATTILEKSGLDPTAYPRVATAKDLIGKISQGQLDAALVFRTELALAGASNDWIELPTYSDSRINYRITTIRSGPLATRFAAYLDSSKGATSALKQVGLLKP